MRPMHLSGYTRQLEPKLRKRQGMSRLERTAQLGTNFPAYDLKLPLPESESCKLFLSENKSCPDEVTVETQLRWSALTYISGFPNRPTLPPFLKSSIPVAS